MKKTINKIDTNYLDEGTGQNILILHGWGSSIMVMQKLFDHLKVSNRVVVLDLPGFGETKEPKTSWNLNDYTKHIIKFMEELNITKPIIIGHSFGGRIAIKLASEYQDIKLNKLILVDSAGIKKESKVSFKTSFLKMMKKTLGKVFPKLVDSFKNKMGSADYRSASPIMKEILVNVINEDLSTLLNKIEYSTLLIWGENDTETPFNDAIVMESKIKDSGIVKVPGAGHYSFLDNPFLVNSAIDSFVNEGGKK